MVFIAGSMGATAEVWTQAAHRPALGYPHAGQIVIRLPSAPAMVAIGFLSLLPELVPAAKAVHADLVSDPAHYGFG
jgi:hypothetical protein